MFLPSTGSVDFESDLSDLRKLGKLSPKRPPSQNNGESSPDFVVITEEVTGSSSPEPTEGDL